MSLARGFVDRERDMAFLEDRWRDPGLQMVVVTGRRRVGKTTLLKEFLQGKPHVYHLAGQEEKSLQLGRFRDALVEALGGVRPEVGDWPDLFAYLGDALTDRGRFLVVIDELPYLVEEDPALPSHLQALLDEHLQGTEAFVCLCGSSIGMMEEQVLSSKSPLYGRRTGRIDLGPFTVIQARQMFPDLAARELFEVYAVLGGTPHYLQFYDPDRGLEENVERLICDPRGPLHDEPEFLLRQEFRRPHRYVSVVQAVAAGRTTPKAIADHTGIAPQSVPKYLDELKRVRLVEHRVPVTEEGKRSRRGVYALSDPFFRFWFRFVAPHRSQAERDPRGLVRQRIAPDLPAHVGDVFEDACRDLVPEVLGGYGRIGAWWYREAEVDILGLDEAEGRLLLAECKWQDDVDADRVRRGLARVAERIRWRKEERTETYAVFAKSFERRTEAAACFDLEDLDAAMR